MVFEYIDKLEADIQEAHNKVSEAENTLRLAKTKENSLRNKLSEIYADTIGIKIGTIIEFNNGRGRCRARVESISAPRFVYYGNRFDLSVSYILRDGSGGERRVVVESSDFEPQCGFVSPRPPRAKVVSENNENS